MRLDERGLERWGEQVGSSVEAPVVIALEGRLGAGKSVFARAVGRGAGVAATMPSPSYNLLLRYDTPGGVDIVHIDLYRIGATDELWELGWSQLGEGDEIVLIEWAERAGDFMPEHHWVIRLTVPDDEPMLRDIEVRRVGRPPELPPFPMSVSVG
ncbi:MAG: tRNA (adenosine(37)-N6)-threonylcarbamoyltransferase complex ATPase subunit type 1 TsaE [Longimicrobiales bacterium]